LLRLVADKTAGPRALSLTTFLHDLGAGYPTGRAIQWGVGACLLAAAGLVVRSADGDRRSFSLVLAAALVLSPVVWLHYFALLLVPLAIARPKFGPAWGLPFTFWLVALVPRGDLYMVSDHGRLLGDFGVVPSAAKVAFALAFLAAITAVAAAKPGARLPHPASIPSPSATATAPSARR
jgi:hypothetical protein